MPNTFRKISRVGRPTGGTKWYLSEDCLLAAKRVMYAVEYRRFYLCDLESIVVWPNRLWLLRPIIPAVLLGAFGALWYRTNFTVCAIFGGMGLAWLLLELALGPTAKTRIRTTGVTVNLPLVWRTRRARKLLAKIDVAVRAARGGVSERPTAPVGAAQPAEPAVQTISETASATAPIEDLS